MGDTRDDRIVRALAGVVCVGLMARIERELARIADTLGRPVQASNRSGDAAPTPRAIEAAVAAIRRGPATPTDLGRSDARR